MRKFVGREKEMDSLARLVRKKTASLVVVYGRRRIGKSRLIEEFGKSNKLISFSGLYPDGATSKIDQLNEFARLYKKQFNKAMDHNNDWSEALDQLAEATKKGRYIIFLDEITWMSHQEPLFLAKLKNIWDMSFKHNDQLILVLCGSVSTWIENNLLSNAGFYGRISLKLQLAELPLNHCNQFWSSQGGNTSDFEKFKILSVTGGIPKYLEEIDISESAEENIRQLCFLKNGLLFNDYHHIFTSLLGHSSRYYNEIIETLSNGSLERSEIVSLMKVESGGHLSDYIDELVVSGFLRREYSWDIKSEQTAKLSKFRLSDNYLRFYTRYILPNAEKIKQDKFENHALSALPGWPIIMGLQVENLVLNNARLINQLIGVYPDEIVSQGPYFQRKTNRQRGCQVDYMVQTKHGVLYLCEIKFSFKGIRSDVIEQVQEKINRLVVPRNFSVKPVLIHLGDVYDEVFFSQYFLKIIDISDLLTLS